MKQVRISDDAHVKIMDSFSSELRNAADVVDMFILTGDISNTTQSTDVDYSQCPNCESKQDQLDAQADTISALKNKNVETGPLYMEIDEKTREIKNLNKQLKEAQRNGGGGTSEKDLSTMMEQENEIDELNKNLTAMTTKYNVLLASSGNEKSKVHMSGGQ